MMRDVRRPRKEATGGKLTTILASGPEEVKNNIPPLGTTPGSEPKPKTWTTGVPAQWGLLGISPTRRQLYCGYVVIAGAANALPAGTMGKDIFNNTPPTSTWWYAVAFCDNDSDGNKA